MITDSIDPANLVRPHILVINHSPDILTLLRVLLEEERFLVTTQSHLDRDLHRIAEMKPDLVILDYPWTTDDNRWTLLQLLKMDRRTVRIPIVLCTGAVREVEALQSHLERMNVVVVLKPFDIDHLVRVVREVLAGAADRRPSLAFDQDVAHSSLSDPVSVEN